MEYQILLSDKAERFLKKIDNSYRQRIIDKLKELRFNPKIGKPLTANLAGFWSLRIGKYRAIYKIEDGRLIVLIFDISHRKDIYDNA